jgi:hypothetical protein
MHGNPEHHSQVFFAPFYLGWLDTNLRLNLSHCPTFPIGLFYENPQLVYAKKAYLDSATDVAAFEQVSGLKIADLPEFPGAFPKRDDRSASRFIIAAPTPFQVRMKPHTYTDDDGETKETTRFAGFLNANPLPPSSTGSAESLDLSTPQAKAFINDVKVATRLIYTAEDGTYNTFQHGASIEKRLKAPRGDKCRITHAMQVNVAATLVMAYRAMKPVAENGLGLTELDFPNALEETTIGRYVKQHGIEYTWKRLCSYVSIDKVAQDQVAHSSLPPTGTDIPF